MPQSRAKTQRRALQERQRKSSSVYKKQKRVDDTQTVKLQEQVQQETQQELEPDEQTSPKVQKANNESQHTPRILSGKNKGRGRQRQKTDTVKHTQTQKYSNSWRKSYNKIKFRSYEYSEQDLLYLMEKLDQNQEPYKQDDWRREPYPSRPYEQLYEYRLASDAGSKFDRDLVTSKLAVKNNDVRKGDEPKLLTDFANVNEDPRSFSDGINMKTLPPPLYLDKDIEERCIWGLDCFTRMVIFDCLDLCKKLFQRNEDDEPLSDQNRANIKNDFIRYEIMTAINMTGEKGWDFGESLKILKQRGEARKDDVLLEVAHNLAAFMEQIENAKAIERGDLYQDENGDLHSLDAQDRCYFRVHPKGQGIICIKEEGIKAWRYCQEYFGEVYPSWRWFERQDAIKKGRENDDLPDFYNITLERPRYDKGGYDVIYVEAINKGQFTSRMSHSCTPNCCNFTARIDDRITNCIMTTKDIRYGEEMCWDYSSVTESEKEYRAAVCLCSTQLCRGSYLHYANSSSFSVVVLEKHNFLNRQALILDSLISQVTYEDIAILQMNGFKGCALTNGATFDLDSNFQKKIDILVQYLQCQRHTIDVQNSNYLESLKNKEGNSAEILQAKSILNQLILGQRNLDDQMEGIHYVKDIEQSKYKVIDPDVLETLPTPWIWKFAAQILRYIDMENKLLPEYLTNPALKILNTYGTSYEWEQAKIEADGVKSNRKINLAVTLDKMKYFLRGQESQQQQEHPLAILSDEECIQHLWFNENSIVNRSFKLCRPYLNMQAYENKYISEHNGKAYPLQDAQIIIEQLKSLVQDLKPKTKQEALQGLENFADILQTAGPIHAPLHDILILYSRCTNYFTLTRFKNIQSMPIIDGQVVGKSEEPNQLQANDFPSNKNQIDNIANEQTQNEVQANSLLGSGFQLPQQMEGAVMQHDITQQNQQIGLDLAPVDERQQQEQDLNSVKKQVKQDQQQISNEQLPQENSILQQIKKQLQPKSYQKKSQQVRQLESQKKSQQNEIAQQSNAFTQDEPQQNNDQSMQIYSAIENVNKTSQNTAKDPQHTDGITQVPQLQTIQKDYPKKQLDTTHNDIQGLDQDTEKKQDQTNANLIEITTDQHVASQNRKEKNQMEIETNPNLDTNETFQITNNTNGQSKALQERPRRGGRGKHSRLQNELQNKVPDVQSFGKKYSPQYLWGQMACWFKQTVADPSASLSADRRGTISLPDLESCYNESGSITYFQKERKALFNHILTNPSSNWPTGSIWHFKNTAKVYGTPMLDEAIQQCKGQVPSKVYECVQKMQSNFN